MSIANYTTKVDPFKTLGDIQKLLVRNGALNVSIDFDSGEASALSFVVEINQVFVPFRLTSNWQGVLKAMEKDREVRPGLCTEAQARRVSWRIEYDWVRAQMAKIEAGKAELAEVFLPYAVTETGETFYQRFQKIGVAGLLKAGSD
ncbi:MAG: hypothetical protein AAGF93_00575 [Cyanobacteria bacterium P01_H01_bin.105]